MKIEYNTLQYIVPNNILNEYIQLKKLFKLKKTGVKTLLNDHCL